MSRLCRKARAPYACRCIRPRGHERNTASSRAGAAAASGSGARDRARANASSSGSLPYTGTIYGYLNPVGCASVIGTATSRVSFQRHARRCNRRCRRRNATVRPLVGKARIPVHRLRHIHKVVPGHDQLLILRKPMSRRGDRVASVVPHRAGRSRLQLLIQRPDRDLHTSSPPGPLPSRS